MSLRNQPYFPLYVQDYLTDEKLNMCEWSSVGIFSKIMCVLHKQESYGAIVYKQTSKQNLSMIDNFALLLVKHIPCQLQDMTNALNDLIENKVLIIEDNKLFQKRMVKDGEVSIKRSLAGKLGGGNPILHKQTSKQIDKQTSKQNTEYEYEYENEDVNEIDNVVETKEYIIAEYLYNKILSINSNHKKPNLMSWAKDIDLMIRIDKRTEEQIKYIIDWLYTGSKDALFWQKNILSTKKLREKFDALILKIKGEKQNDIVEGTKSELAKFLASDN